MSKLRPVDAIWASMDRPNNLMVIEALVLLQGRVDWSRVQAVLTERVVKEFRVFSQRLEPARWALGVPRWTDDPEFNVERHIHRVRLPAPGDDAALRRYVEARMSEPLDRAHPLWEAHFIDGHRSHALFMRMHHSIADGITLARLLLSLTDATPDEAARPERRDGPESSILASESAVVRRAWGTIAGAGRTGAAVVANGVTVAASLAGALPRRLRPRAIADLAVQAGRVVAIADKLLLGHDPPSLLVREPGTAKLAVWSRTFTVDEISAVARLTGSTINDVLMSSVAGAISNYLIDHGAAAQDLSTMVPVNVRGTDTSLTRELGNRFALVLVRLPIGVQAPLARLAETKRRMDVIKSSPEAAITFALIMAIGRTSASLERRLVDFFAGKAIGVTTNVIGPPAPRYLAGSEIAGVLAWVPSSGQQTFGMCIVSYNKTVRVGFKVDAGTVADPESLVDAFNRQVDTLLRVADAAKVERAPATRNGRPSTRARTTAAKALAR